MQFVHTLDLFAPKGSKLEAKGTQCIVITEFCAKDPASAVFLQLVQADDDMLSLTPAMAVPGVR